MSHRIEALAGRYDTTLACASGGGESKRLIGSLIVDDGNAWSYRFTVAIAESEPVEYASLAAAVRHYNEGAR